MKDKKRALRRHHAERIIKKRLSQVAAYASWGQNHLERILAPPKEPPWWLSYDWASQVFWFGHDDVVSQTYPGHFRDVSYYSKWNHGKNRRMKHAPRRRQGDDKYIERQKLREFTLDLERGLIPLDADFNNQYGHRDYPSWRVREVK